jgi:dTDP-4-dehydrorhamnose reductase
VRWMVTGAGGALGTDLARLLRADGERVTALTRTELDITDAEAVERAVARWARGPAGADAAGDAAGDPAGDDRAVLLNAAAFTAVDLAETDPDAARAAHEVNSVAPGLLAAACARHGARIVHVSTDYVFDGAGPAGRTAPDGGRAGYEPDDPTGPAGVYGRTKEEGEQRVREAAPAHHVVRTAWVYGGTGANFVRTMARLAGERDTLDVVDDQHGSPTWSRDLAAGLVALGRSDAAPGTLHATGGGVTTWCGFARAVFEELGADPARVTGCTTAQFPRPAPRPAWSVLSPASWTAAGLPALRPWREALSGAVVSHPELLGRARVVR